MSFLYRAFFILCLTFVFTQSAEAGNTRSANVGDPIPAIAWNVSGAANCVPSALYPNNADGIRAFWYSLTPAGNSSTNFGGRTIGAAAGSYTFTCTAGTASDTSTLVVCNNVTQESDGGAACVAKAPATPTGLAATPGACSTGQISLDWDDVPGATTYTLRDGATVIYSGSDSDYVHTGLTAGSAHSYTVRAQNTLNSAYSASVNATAPAACVYPDLVVQSTTLPSATLTQGVPITLLGTVRNAGTATTSTGFANNFSYDTGSGWVDLPDIAKGSLPGGTTALQDSQSYTPTALGTIRFQYCVDSNNQVNESTGETPNCVQSAFVNVVVPVPGTPTGLVLNVGAAGVPACGGRMTAAWNSVSGATSYEISIDGSPYTNIGNVTNYQFNSLVPGSSHTVRVIARNSSGASAPASATANASAACNTLTVGNCTIPDLSRTCNTTVTWDITGATTPSIYNLTRTLTVPGTSMATGTAVAITLERSTAFGNESTGNNVIEARDGATVLQTRTAVASCGASSCCHPGGTGQRCQPIPKILSTPNPAWIRSGEEANLTFGILANYPGVNCTFTGAMSSAAPIAHTAAASRTNYVRTTDTLTAAQVVRVSCTAPGLATPVTGEVRVNVLPDVQEI